MIDLAGAFPDEPTLESRVAAASSVPNHAQLFHDLAVYIIRLQHEIKDLKRKLGDTSTNGIHPPVDGPPSKKRKFPERNGQQQNGGGSSPHMAWRTANASFVAKEISFSVPVRKKLTLEVIEGVEGGMRGVNTTSGDMEVGMAWKDVEQVICVPVPEKAQPSFNFVIVPSVSSEIIPTEPIVWTVPATIPKNVTLDEAGEGDTYDAVLKRVLNRALVRVGKKVTCPNEEEFVSGIVQAHRKGEKAWHVKAFRGSKDGYLYFLSTGILFGFKKPILFFPFSTVISVSYSSVLQRTFNLNVTASSLTAADSSEPQEFEFGMLDQADYDGVNRYIKGHGLHDASLAAERKAKRVNVNGVRKDANGEVKTEGSDDEEEEGELAKAERALQDAEDEVEEDYDPGSAGESEGSGTEDESENGDEGGDGEDVDEEVEVEGEDEEEEP